MVKIKWCETCKARKNYQIIIKNAVIYIKNLNDIFNMKKQEKKDSNIVKIPYIEIS